MNRQGMQMMTGAGWLAMVVAGFASRPLVPIDETRYVTVAWEMWTNGSFAVPLLNGSPYAHKPPLLFWLMHAGWAIFGVNEWWPRLIGPLCALANLFLIDRLACRLWPQFPVVRYLAPLIFVSTWFVAVYLTAVMFDMLLLTCILGAWLALHDGLHQSITRGATIFGVMLGLGVLAKGPVVFVYTLPVAFAAPWWFGDAKSIAWRRWYVAIVAAVGLGIAIPCVWLLAATYTGDSGYFRTLLVDQTVERVAGNLGRGRPYWWYLPLLPVLLLPWIAWVSVWRGLHCLTRAPADSGVRFVGIAIAMTLALLSLIGGKQVHYLLPLLSLAALLMARAIEALPLADRRVDRLPLGAIAVPILIISIVAPLVFAHVDARLPIWYLALLLLPMLGVMIPKTRPARYVTPAIAALSLFCAAISMAAIFHVFRSEFDLEPLGRYLGQLQRENHPLAIVGIYEGQFGFYGRLRQPITPLTLDGAKAWALQHPTGFIITEPGRQSLSSQAEFRQHTLDGDWVVIRSGVLRDEVSMNSVQ